MAPVKVADPFDVLRTRATTTVDTTKKGATPDLSPEAWERSKRRP